MEIVFPVACRHSPVNSSNDALHSAPSADVVDLSCMSRHIVQLNLEQIKEVLYMQEIPHLFSVPAKSDIGKRPLEVMSGNPEHGNPLVYLSHLPRTGEHPAPIDDRVEVIQRDILIDQKLRTQFRGSVESPCPVERKILCDALGGETGKRSVQLPLKSCRSFPARQCVQRPVWIHATRRKKYQLCLMPPSQLQTIDSADKIGVHDIGRSSVEPRQRRRFCRTFDDRINLTHSVQVGTIADVTVAEVDSPAA